ncbi:hypothetical protein EI42_02258 [Thermosporothrix hazakensis]|jgi:sterol desaturase/sphingolipid hydroxylase (fatty acid hydroxylase superfamily)|uniref:Uncharacterized protein n=2 Tax=Thermosporothrix TaxID=768650 RepID=A0A326UHG8_THEHA|nr:DUF6755 family protein [Thermosporothrix hazakensis]PZW31161.1 hypothetical protein EI42_02258 [Thermosporothrix hazakensis]BBH86618.1 hypothetical protein KTC_13690 [Thermosporothrix sp. COM3]GCE50927.1 hypothetical protein KTH_57960 [Thermosporothrix hazakensis]
MNQDHMLLSENTANIKRTLPPGQMAIASSALVLGLLLMAIQLWLLTISLEQYLAGQHVHLWIVVLISGLIFLGGLLIFRALGKKA